MVKEKKSFKKYAKKHLATVIENRRKGAKAKKEKMERVEKKKLREAKETEREEREHHEQLERLKETDPGFYSYLEEEDPTLLEFGNQDLDFIDEDVGSDAETEVDEEAMDSDAGGVDRTEREGSVDSCKSDVLTEVSRITAEELDRLIARKNVEACIDMLVSSVRELGYPVKEAPKARSTRKFEDPSLVKECIIRVAQFIASNLSTVITGKGAFKSHKTRYLMKRFLYALVATIAEGTIDSVLTVGVLHALTPFVPVLHYIRGMTKSVLKTALALCATVEESVRIAAYVIVRAIATRATGTRTMYQSTAFKGIFLILIRTAHHYNIHTAPLVAFLTNCVVDLYGTDMEAAYQHTFVYLRQLAIYLRAALQQQTPSNVRTVVNWQYLNALRTWGAVVSKYPEALQLGPLIHPIVQLGTGLMDLFSSPRMFPMHLQIIEILNHISIRADGLFIPVAPYLLRILTSPSVSLERNAKAGGEPGEAVDLRFTIRVKKSHARSFSYHRAVWLEALYLLTEHLATHSHTVGFPEAFWVVESTLKRIRAEVKVPKINTQLGTLLRHMRSTSQRIVARREQTNTGPCDLTAVKQLEDELQKDPSPLAVYYQSLRQHRIEEFSARQRDASGKERATLDAAIDTKQTRRKRSRGSGFVSEAS
ncbi:putative Noc2p family [Trypanosoma vivax]|uniref:Nucleolar complex protein 2 n=1 Tax=Trypanosoma vivax (strain Y486) TaxID=1055687 RepID=G0U408_TRYVY|nr:hypothetical protein TRVL_02128 [Trypanosoma vivax]KAH8612071.1 putative Noc2p family [Trypanosoma vivax]CCC52170.1 conserved hypothetical protein [Trypanosoma vivax Y486]